MSRLRQAGVTLVELIIAVVIISVAVTGILMAYVQTVRSSADPMIEAQALAIAEAYLDEILARPVAGTASACDTTSNDLATGRGSCAVVGDYAGISNQAPHDQFGNPIGALSTYSVTVAVSGGAAALPSDALGVGEEASVTVTVTRGTTAITLRGYKVDY